MRTHKCVYVLFSEVFKNMNEPAPIPLKKWIDRIHKDGYDIVIVDPSFYDITGEEATKRLNWMEGNEIHHDMYTIRVPLFGMSQSVIVNGYDHVTMKVHVIKNDSYSEEENIENLKKAWDTVTQKTFFFT